MALDQRRYALQRTERLDPIRVNIGDLSHKSLGLSCSATQRQSAFAQHIIVNPVLEIPVITGPELFNIEVAGCDRYLQSFINVCGSDRRDAVDMVVQAHLTLEDMHPLDDSAVAVSVSGHLIGYLPRPTALEFRKAIEVGDLTEYKVFECRARIRGGGLGAREYQPSHTAWLDLPQDDDCQPTVREKPTPVDESLIQVYRNTAIADRQIDELIGIVKGVMADGMVTHGEVEFLLRWMEANRQAANLWPAKALYPRLAQVAAKGFMTLHEEGEMLDLLMKKVGGNTAPQTGFASNSTKLPLTDPSAPLSFEGRAFCFTGVFHSGTRDWCHSQVTSRGGRGIGNITKKLDYLVIGDIGNESWAHSTHGRKIEKAIEYNLAGCCIAIVSEEHWYSHL
ncbi:MAG: BRCT domain-containing protein [Janthinobacterium lividum]